MELQRVSVASDSPLPSRPGAAPLPRARASEGLAGTSAKPPQPPPGAAEPPAAAAPPGAGGRRGCRGRPPGRPRPRAWRTGGGDPPRPDAPGADLSGPFSNELELAPRPDLAVQVVLVHDGPVLLVQLQLPWPPISNGSSASHPSQAARPERSPRPVVGRPALSPSRTARRSGPAAQVSSLPSLQHAPNRPRQLVSSSHCTMVGGSRPLSGSEKAQPGGI